MPARRTLILGLALALAACTESGPTSPAEEPVADALAGQFAFTRECSSCHASGDGLDLAFFGFADSTIIRRAVAHVDTATARDIVAHVRSLGVAPAGDLRLFQPAGLILDSDVSFAVRLFGTDAWPAGLTTAALRAIDPRQVAVALAMPAWSDEETNLDWMPDRPLPAAILDYQGGAAAAALAAYDRVQSETNLVRAVVALRGADRMEDNPAAPCVLSEPDRVDHAVCFEVRRWTSTLVAQHLIRFGAGAEVRTVLHDTWWDVGNVARRSTSRDATPVANAEANWASWMYLGWTFDPSRHASVYTGGGLQRVGLPRHATFLALRSQVARDRHGVAVYMDARNAVNFAPASWVTEVALFGLRQLTERQAEAGSPLSDEQRAEAVLAVETLRRTVERRVPADRRAEVLAEADWVLAGLGES